jgi:hypothetical protein
LTFTVLDRSSTAFFERHPEVLKKRLKQSSFKPPNLSRRKPWAKAKHKIGDIGSRSLRSLRQFRYASGAESLPLLPAVSGRKVWSTCGAVFFHRVTFAT